MGERRPFGYHGCYLRIDVSRASVDRVALPEEVLRQYLGGSGLGAWLLRQEGKPAGEPLAAEAPLIFAFSPLVGSPLTTSAKFAVVSKSPLTGRINDALAGSGFALAGKRTGADALVIVGRAPSLSTLIIDGGGIRLEGAEDLRGAACDVTERTVRSGLGADWQVASIGAAGEGLVRYATISHDGRHAGRGGSGAVLGSKNLKAIAVRGTEHCEWAHPRELGEYGRRLATLSFGEATEKYRELGTASNLTSFNRLGVLPTRNFRSGSFAEAGLIAPERLRESHRRTRASCVACTIGCEHSYELGDKNGVRLEYESLFALGPLCGVSDGESVLRAARRCDELGLDTISTGGTIAFAMECAEGGLIDEPWLRFGSGDALLRAVAMIGTREGLGDLLAEGSRLAAQAIGQDSIRFAPQVKGLEIPGYEPRALQMMALGFAVGSRGADHNRSGAYEVDFSEKVDRRRVTIDDVHHAIATEDKAALMDSLILCKFLRGVFDDFYAEAADMLRLVTGWEMTSGELRETAARIVREKQIFNVLAGWTPQEDTLPDRFLDTRPDNDPSAALSRQRLEDLVNEYHRQRGWHVV